MIQNVIPTLSNKEEKHVKDSKNTIVRGHKYIERFLRFPNVFSKILKLFF